MFSTRQSRPREDDGEETNNNNATSAPIAFRYTQLLFDDQNNTGSGLQLTLSAGRSCEDSATALSAKSHACGERLAISVNKILRFGEVARAPPSHRIGSDPNKYNRMRQGRKNVVQEVRLEYHLEKEEEKKKIVILMLRHQKRRDRIYFETNTVEHF